MQTIMKSHSYVSPPEIISGIGCLEGAMTRMKKLGDKALVVTDETMSKAGLVEELTGLLRKAGIEAAVYDRVNEEPTTTHVEEGVACMEENKCQFLVGLGGGSPIDAAKIISAAAKHEQTSKDFQGIDKIKGPIYPLVAIPTTAGTGTEVTRVSIITDKTDNVKMLIISNYLVPDMAVCDSNLTVSMPRRLTAATGLDALTHAVEAYISIKAQPMTDILALEAVRLLSLYLRRAWCNGADLEARYYTMHAATLAGLAFSNSSVALVHGMSRPIGACFGVPHGISNAVLLPAVCRFTLPGAIERFARLAEVMGEPVSGLSRLETAERAVVFLERLCQDFNMLGLKNAGVERDELKDMAAKMARDAIASGSPGNNPRIATEEEIVQLYMDAY